MKKRIQYMMIVACLLGGNCFAAAVPAVIDWEVGAQWQAYGFMDTTQNDDTEDEVMSDNRILWTNDLSWEEQDVFFKADVQWRYETYKGMDTESRAQARFRDLYGDMKRQNFEIAVGQKTVTWGKLDDFVILDRVSPQDYSHFILYDKEERKDPVLMAQYQWFGWEGMTLETVYMPEFRSSDLDFFGTNWAVFGHLKEAVSGSSDYTAAQKAIVSGISIQEDDRVTDHALGNSQVAFRLRGRRQEVDYGVYYMNLYHSLPVLKETNPTGNTVKQFLYDPTAANLTALTGAGGNDLVLTEAHPRIQVVGLDWETVWGAVGLRGETAFVVGMPYLKEDFSYTEENLVSFGIGVDHTTDSQWYFDVQYLQDYVFNYDGLYGMEEAPFLFSGTVAKDFCRGVVGLDLDWVWNASYGDWMLNPEATYTWERSGVDVSVGMFVFQDGSSKTVFGRFDRNDTAYLKVGGKF